MVIGMEIRIQSQNALIGIERTDGQFSIHQKQWPMELNTVDSIQKIKMTDAVLYIDQRQSFSEAGLKSIMEMSRVFAAKGRSAALRGINRIAREGKELADIHRGRAIFRQAKRRFAAKTREVTFDMIPKTRPKITVIPGEVTGEFRKGYVDIKLGKTKPDVQYYPGKLDIYLRQKNNLEIQFVGTKLDVYGG